MVLTHFFNGKSETAQSQAADFFKAIFSRLAEWLGEILAVVSRPRSQADSYQAGRLRIRAPHRQEMPLVWRQSRGNSKKQ